MAQYSAKAKRFIRRHPSQDAFINILEGTIRSGKNWTMIPKLIFGLNHYNVGGERIIMGVSKETVYNNVLNDLFSFVGIKNYTYNRQTGELWLRGVRWRVIGAKDEGAEKYIRGGTFGIVYMDEIVLIPKTVFEMTLGRMSPEGARFYGTTNPDNPFHYLNVEYITDETKKASGMVFVEHFNLDDNLSLSESKKEQYRSMYKGVFKKRMIDGLWVVAEGAIYKDSWSEDLLYNDDTRPISLGNSGGYVEMFIPIDYGTGNPTVFLHIIDDGKLYWVDREYYWDSRETTIQKTDGQYVADLIQFRDNYAKDAVCIVDPSAASLKAEMTQKGVWHTDADNDVENGIRVVSSLLAQKKMRIHERCKKLRAEMESYAWDPKKQKQGLDEPLKQHDHAPDALRYFVKTKVPEWRLAA